MTLTFIDKYSAYLKYENSFVIKEIKKLKLCFHYYDHIKIICLDISEHFQCQVAAKLKSWVGSMKSRAEILITVTAKFALRNITVF